jgi:hypothetical protein
MHQVPSWTHEVNPGEPTHRGLSVESRVTAAARPAGVGVGVGVVVRVEEQDDIVRRSTAVEFR